MKQKDIALIIIVSVVSGVFSLLLSNVMFGSEEDKQQRAEVVSKITSEFNEPSKKYFNTESINPTQLIRIGNGGNTSPFKSN